MPIFLWKKSYEIGVADLDMQHRHLVGLINELSDAMMLKQGFRAVPHVLDELVDYIQLHFTTEEAAMRDAHYHGLPGHSQEHLDLTGQVLEFKAEYASAHDLDPGELLTFLCDWLKIHILVSDNAFGRYLLRVDTDEA